ncbi:MAG: hypothetical protein LBG58_17185, partial [Planctomycetaceae bacterium]|nr:hypothetical protein [Planctomycetaceae bacterium]
MSSPQIALVGTTRAGKSVLMTVLAKRLENKRNGVWLKPLGKTYSQIEEWWDTLQSGEWLPPTTPGTLLELNWDLCIQDKRIPMRMFDYAGENLTDLFSGKADNQQGAAKEFFDKVKDNFDNSTIIIVLLNLESFLDPDKKTVRENKGTPINAMTDFLKQAKNRSEELHIAFVFTAFDRYKATIEGSRSKYGSYEKFLRQEIPPLYNEFIDTNSPVRVFAVSAVADTETFTDTATGKTESRPKPGFRSEGIAEFLIPWLSQAVLGAQTQIDIQNEEARQDAENGKYVTELVSQWNSIVNSEELQAVERIITEANKPLPYPNRPGASALNTERNKVLNYAIDLRSKIQTRQWENTK